MLIRGCAVDARQEALQRCVGLRLLAHDLLQLLSRCLAGCITFFDSPVCVCAGFDKIIDGLRRESVTYLRLHLTSCGIDQGPESLRYAISELVGRRRHGP